MCQLLFVDYHVKHISFVNYHLKLEKMKKVIKFCSHLGSCCSAAQIMTARRNCSLRPRVTCVRISSFSWYIHLPRHICCSKKKLWKLHTVWIILYDIAYITKCATKLFTRRDSLQMNSLRVNSLRVNSLQKSPCREISWRAQVVVIS